LRNNTNNEAYFCHIIFFNVSSAYSRIYNEHPLLPWENRITGMDMGCCGNEQMIFQFIPDDQMVQSENTVFKAPLLEIIEIASLRSIDHEDHERVALKICNSPPPEKIPIWLKNSNFTFYG
jgi:hypothetical protein